MVTRYGAVFAACFVALGCFDVTTVDPGPKPTPAELVSPVPADERGWVAPGTNELGIQGFWFSYGDQYDKPKRCTDYGEHPPDTGDHGDEECSFVGFPDPAPSLWLPNEGKLCTSGNGAKVNECEAGVECQDPNNLDYSSMWGAGLGLDFGLEIDPDGMDPTRHPESRTTWNAVNHGTTGVSFDITWPDPTTKRYLRVEFPIKLPADGLVITKTTVLRDGTPIHADAADPKPLPYGTTSEEHPSGSPFLNAPSTWPKEDKSLILDGHVEIRWSKVHNPPETDYDFDPATLEMLGIQFHVPTISDERTPYAFCISNLAFLRE